MKKIYTLLMMAMMAISANAAAGDNADWFIYFYSESVSGDFGQFKETETANVYIASGVDVPASGLNFCIHNQAWSTNYGWSDEGGSLDAIDKAVKLATANGATGWISLPVGRYDFTWNATDLTITAKESAATPIPTELKAYDSNLETGKGTLAAKAGSEGVFVGQINAEAWENFKVKDEVNSIVYGCDPNNISKITSANDMWNMWVGENAGTYTIEIDLNAMTWTATYVDPSSIENVKGAKKGFMPDTYYDLSGRRIEKPAKGLYIVNGKVYSSNE